MPVVQGEQQPVEQVSRVSARRQVELVCAAQGWDWARLGFGWLDIHLGPRPIQALRGRIARP